MWKAAWDGVVIVTVVFFWAFFLLQMFPATCQPGYQAVATGRAGYWCASGHKWSEQDITR